MSNFNSVDLNGPVDPAQLKAMSDQLDGQSNRAKGPQIHIQDMRRMDITFHDGQMTATPLHRGHVETSNPIPAGHVEIPGMGITPIAAAIAGGVLPQGWTPGQPTPWNPKGTPAGFSAPSGSHAQQNAEGPEGDAEQQQQQDADTSPEHLARKADVETASKTLEEADRFLGADVVDDLMNAAADMGELPDVDNLPEWITDEVVQQIASGYVAQANDTLAEINVTVAGLEATLTEAELRQCRQAVLAGDAQRLLQLGQVSLSRLEQLPKKDPEAFQRAIEAMPEEERKAFRYNAQRRDWSYTDPDHGELSFGAAVRLGLLTI